MRTTFDASFSGVPEMLSAPGTVRMAPARSRFMLLPSKASGAGDCFGETREIDQYAAAIVPACGVGGIGCEGRIQTLKRFSITVQRHQHHPAIAVSVGGVGIQRQYVIETDQRFGWAIKPLQRAAAGEEAVAR